MIQYDSMYVRALEIAGYNVDTINYSRFGTSSEDIGNALSGKNLIIHGPGSANGKPMLGNLIAMEIPALTLDEGVAVKYGLADASKSNGSVSEWESNTNDSTSAHPIIDGISFPITLAGTSAVKNLRASDTNHASGLEYIALIKSSNNYTIAIAPVGNTVLDANSTNSSARNAGDNIAQSTVGYFSGMDNTLFNTTIGSLFLKTVEYIIPTVWNGSGWSYGTPDAKRTAIIAENYSGAGFTCRALKVNENASLTITSGTMDVQANVYNKGTISIESGSSLITSGNAHLYEFDEGWSKDDYNFWEGNGATIERTTRYAGGKYSFVGSPVASDASITGSDLGTYVYSYNEATAFGADGLARWENASATELVPGIGYAQAGQQDISFTGVPNAGDIVVSGTYTTDDSDDNEGWNLIANPYAGAIQVSSFLTAHSSNLQPAVYIWDDNNSADARGDDSDYIVANGSGVTTNSTAANGSRYNNHIGSMQGFLVQLIDGQSTDITFADSMKVSGNNSDDNFFRKASNNDLIRVNLTAKNGLFKQTVIGFPENASDIEKNSLYDAPVFSKDAANAIFTAKGDKALAIQGVSKYRASVDMMVNLAEAGTYTIAIQKEGNVENTVFLRDKLTNELISLEEGGYTFTSSAAKAADRFEIIFESSNILASKNALAETLKVSIDADKNLKVFATNNTLKSYNIYNLMGSKMATFNTKREHTFNASNLKSGVYIISDGSSAIKFIIR